MATRTATTAHFTPELFTFLRALQRNNDREWFQRNRDRYDAHVRDPMLRFITDFAPRLRAVSRHFVADPSPTGGSMLRIHRDVRFSKDKSPYKTAATAHFRHVRGRDVHAPGFALHLGTDGVYAGTGIWRPDRPSLEAIRRRIADQPAAWTRATRSAGFADGTLALHGGALKRPPRGVPPDHRHVEDLKRTDFVTMTPLDEEAACSPGLLDRYASICTASRPFMRFLTKALDLEF